MTVMDKRSFGRAVFYLSLLVLAGFAGYRLGYNKALRDVADKLCAVGIEKLCLRAQQERQGQRKQ